MRGRHQIKASAGSGKTYRLTQEFLHELADYDRKSGKNFQYSQQSPLRAVNQILAITFTNAAATEMRARVIRQLKDIALGNVPDDLLSAQAARQWLSAILRDMNSLNIRTIDSLLHLIIRSAALDLGINPDFEPGFSTQEIFEPYLDRFLDLADQDPQVHELVVEALKGALEYGGSTGFLLKSKFEDNLFPVLENVILNKYSQLSTKQDILDRIRSLEEEAVQAASDILACPETRTMNKRAEKFFTEFRNKNIPDRPGSYESKSCAAELYNGKGSVSSQTEACYAEFKLKSQRYRRLSRIFRKALQVLPYITIATALVENFNQNNLSTLPTVLVPHLAGMILGSGQGVPDALCRLGTRLSHFLVDEFQDTSREQWAVLHALAEEGLAKGGSLTWVGDVKQSIYGWRGGEPALFDTVRSDPALSAIAPEVKRTPLNINWRSKPLIVNHTNKLFSLLSEREFTRQLFAEKILADAPAKIVDDVVETLHASYSDVQQTCHDPSSGQGYIYAEIITADKNDTANPLILERLQDLLLSQIRKRHDWSDVMVLCRTKDQCGEIAKSLLEKDIPVVTENSLLLADHPLVVQIIAFLQFLQNPADDLAFWTIISGSIFKDHPETALDDQILNNWLASLSENDRQLPLYTAFSRDFPDQWQNLLKPFYSQASLLTPYDMTMEWYKRLGIEERFSVDHTFLRRFLEILNGAEQNGYRSVSAFLEFWQKKGVEEKAPLPETANAIRIMTIHKAKGLEKPVVIIPWTNFSVRSSTAPIVKKIEGLTIPTTLNDLGFGDDYWQDFARQLIEIVNLLYVAFTRPRDELYFFLPQIKSIYTPSLVPVLKKLIEAAGFVKQDEQQVAEPNTAALYYTQGVLPPKKISLQKAEQPSSKKTINLRKFMPDYPDDFMGPVAPWRPMQWLPKLKLFRAHPASESFSADKEGLFMHFCLEKLTFNYSPKEDAARAFKFGLRHSGITVPDNPELRQRLLDDLEWFASLPDAGNWLQKGWPEQPMLDQQGRLLRADLIVPEDDGALVIDYKTGKPGLKYRDQLQTYMRCLANSSQFPGKLRGLLIYLDRRVVEPVNFIQHN